MTQKLTFLCGCLKTPENSIKSSRSPVTGKQYFTCRSCYNKKQREHYEETGGNYGRQLRKRGFK